MHDIACVHGVCMSEGWGTCSDMGTYIWELRFSRVVNRQYVSDFVLLQLLSLLGSYNEVFICTLINFLIQSTLQCRDIFLT